MASRTHPKRVESTFGKLRWLTIAGLAMAGVSGCGNAEDHEIEAKLDTISAHRTAHPHYPIVVFGDFGNDNPPVGVLVDVYGFYVHATTKADATATVLSAKQATAQLEKTFEQAILAVRKAEAENPAPVAPLPSNTDWRVAPHPKLGAYTIVSRFGAKPHSFDVAVPGTDLATIRPTLGSEAAAVIADGVAAQDRALAAMSTPCGFSLCTTELLSIQQGSRGIEPHLMGAPLMIVPVDKRLALKGLSASIQKLLASTAKLKPAPASAHVVVTAPGFSRTYEIPLAGSGEAQGIKACLDDMSALLDALNKKAG